MPRIPALTHSAINVEVYKDNENAKAINSGKAKNRAIYGHAKPEKIEELKDEGIEVSTIPWIQDDH